MQLFHKILSGMANSVDVDQTDPSAAVLSGSALFARAILSETQVLGHLSYCGFCLSSCLTLVMLNKLKYHAHF